MEIKDKCDLLYKTIDKTDFYWNFFYISSFGVFLFLLRGEMNNYSVAIKIISGVFYIVFNIFNALALIRAYRFVYLLLEELKPNIKEVFSTRELREALMRLSYKKKPALVIISYVIVTIINCILLYI